MGDIEWCTPDSGTIWWPYEGQRLVNNSLYYAAKAFEFALRTVGQLVLLFLPSGVKIGLLVDGFVPDFKMDEKKFWGFTIKINDVPVPGLSRKPFPKGGVREIWQGILGQKDIWIEGSEYWAYFKDDEGNWKPGWMFTPDKQYGVFHNAFLDVGTAILVALVGFALWKTGIPKMCGTFLKNAISSGYKLARIQKSRAAAQGYEEISEDVDDLEQYFAENKELLQMISSKIGVRLVIGK
jgi:hypothetical protein